MKEVKHIKQIAEVTLKDSTEVINAPAKIEFPVNAYHKIRALTDISFIMFEEK